MVLTLIRMVLVLYGPLLSSLYLTGKHKFHFELTTDSSVLIVVSQDTCKQKAELYLVVASQLCVHFQGSVGVFHKVSAAPLVCV